MEQKRAPLEKHSHLDGILIRLDDIETLDHIETVGIDVYLLIEV